MDVDAGLDPRDRRAAPISGRPNRLGDLHHGPREATTRQTHLYQKIARKTPPPLWTAWPIWARRMSTPYSLMRRVTCPRAWRGLGTRAEDCQPHQRFTVSPGNRQVPAEAHGQHGLRARPCTPTDPQRACPPLRAHKGLRAPRSSPALLGDGGHGAIPAGLLRAPTHSGDTGHRPCRRIWRRPHHEPQPIAASCPLGPIDTSP